MTKGEIDNSRYNQVDPMKLEAEQLLSYFRLASGSSLLNNFAERNPYYDFEDTDIELSDVGFVEDFVEQKRYMYNKKER